MFVRKLFFALAIAPMLLWSIDSQASVYRFNVSCSVGSKVTEWHVGKIDPGKEYLRVLTGLNNAGCSISDADKSSNLPVETIRGTAAIFNGIPFAGKLFWELGKLFL